MRPEVDAKLCIDCATCVKFCPVGAISISKK
ncbi:MAG: 4Fe-4S binding protein [Nanoarchaeota archaeon]|nr:4Fe-4S binding protein [Nanoarchaeota archaeon]MBU4300312.1 4Fe-4S binding protein [Nanoarchaeota archaeon]MBU4452041.1 4Fe-4S binding protein [Nanoarchaeota archaeon]